MSDELAYTLQEKFLTQQRVAASCSVTKEATLEITHLIDFNRLLLQVEAYVTTERLVEETKRVRVIMDFPKTPWQFFKLNHENAWYMRWLIKRRPPITDHHMATRDVKFDRYAFYPDSTVKPREFNAFKYLGRAVIHEEYTVEEVGDSSPSPNSKS